MGYDITDLHHVAFLYVDLRDDARYLRLDLDLVARFYLACQHSAALDLAGRGADEFIFFFFRAGFHEKIDECPDENSGDQTPHEYPQNFLHSVFYGVTLVIFSVVCSGVA